MAGIKVRRSLFAIRYSPFAASALAVVLTLFAATAQAASPEENYLAARDAAIARLNPPGDPVAPSEVANKDEERARDEVGKLMRAVIGPLNVKGFAGEGWELCEVDLKGFLFHTERLEVEFVNPIVRNTLEPPFEPVDGLGFEFFEQVFTS